jgi:prepilin-type N-terminal cleavage/methylation domain-containing protein
MKTVSKIKGFTIIELLVVTGIFAMMTTLVLANYPRFNAQIILENTAYEVALEVRQAQSFGLGVREAAAAAGTFPGYGVRIPDITVDNTQVYLYADIPPMPGSDGNKMYDGGMSCVPGVDECVEVLELRNYSIYAICGNWRTDYPLEPAFREISDVDGYVGTGHCAIDSVDINFARPNPDAFLQGYDGGVVNHPLPDGYSDVAIVITTSDGQVRTVVVWSTGQITVE